MVTHYEFILPKSFQAADYLPLRLATRADDANWLVSTIVRKTAIKDVDPWGCVRLHSNLLRPGHVLAEKQAFRSTEGVPGYQNTFSASDGLQGPRSYPFERFSTTLGGS